MRRLPVYFADDILVEEIVAMARAQGFHIRFVNGMTVCDRVPNLVLKVVPAEVLPIKSTRSKT